VLEAKGQLKARKPFTRTKKFGWDPPSAAGQQPALRWIGAGLELGPGHAQAPLRAIARRARPNSIAVDG
jgi:hypothetical protein